MSSPARRTPWPYRFPRLATRLATRPATRLATCLAIAACTPSLAAQEDPWKAYRDGRQPAPREVRGLVNQLDELLGNPDPDLRDGTAYTLLSRWLLADGTVDEALCAELGKRWTTNLSRHRAPAARARRTEQQRDRDTLRRSFSALSLALLAKRELDRPFLGQAATGELVAATCAYLASEPDERGYDPKLGWIHCTAHGADLVRQLVKNPRITSDQRARLADAITHRVQHLRTAFPAGEDDRLARALLEWTRTPDFETKSLRDWLTSISNVARPEKLTHRIAFGHNRRLVVQALLIRLQLTPDPTDRTRACAELCRQALLGKFQKPR